MYNSIIFLDCTKPAVEEFPSDFLTAEQRENGGIILHFIIGKIFNHLVDIRIRVHTILILIINLNSTKWSIKIKFIFLFSDVPDIRIGKYM